MRAGSSCIFRSDSRYSAMSPSGGPTHDEPSPTTLSPVNSTARSRRKKQRWFGACPGKCNTSKCILPTGMASPPSSGRPISTPKRVLSVSAAEGCAHSGHPNAFCSPAAPPAWSGWQCVSTSAFTRGRPARSHAVRTSATPSSPPWPASMRTASPPWVTRNTLVVVAGSSVGDGTGTMATPWEFSTASSTSGVFCSMTSSRSASGSRKRRMASAAPPPAASSRISAGWAASAAACRPRGGPPPRTAAAIRPRPPRGRRERARCRPSRPR